MNFALERKTFTSDSVLRVPIMHNHRFKVEIVQTFIGYQNINRRDLDFGDIKNKIPRTQEANLLFIFNIADWLLIFRMHSDVTFVCFHSMHRWMFRIFFTQ